VTQACEELGISESALRRWMEAEAVEMGAKEGLGETFPSRAQGRLDTFDCIEVHFNRQRRHSYDGNLKPLATERFCAQYGRRPDGLDDVLAHAALARAPQKGSSSPAPSLVIPSALLKRRGRDLGPDAPSSTKFLPSRLGNTAGMCQSMRSRSSSLLLIGAPLVAALACALGCRPGRFSGAEPDGGNAAPVEGAARRDGALDRDLAQACGNGSCDGSQTPVTCAADCWRIVSYGFGNTAESQRSLGVTGVRGGCSSAPAGCVEWFRTALVLHPVVSVTITPAWGLSSIEDCARQYSVLSVTTPWLREIGWDDFVAGFGSWIGSHGVGAAGLLERPIDGLKRANPRLRFGITLYEDELPSSMLSDAQLPPALKARVEVVYVYLHYRRNAPGYADYVQQVKVMFPRASIIAGAYAYDRIDYLACASNPDAAVEERRDRWDRVLPGLLRSGGGVAGLGRPGLVQAGT
jgi:hypothetical protein